MNAPTQSRVTALGGYNISLLNTDPNLFVNNPASSSDTLAGWGTASYVFYFADIGMANIAYRHNHSKLGDFGLAVQHIDLGNIESFDETGTYNGSFKSAETTLIVNHSRTSGNFVFGANAKILFSNIAAYRSSAMLFDLGGLFVHPGKDFTAGLAIKNMGFVLSDYNEVNRALLPWDVQAGVTFKPENMPARFSITAYNLARWGDSLFPYEDKETTFTQIFSHTTWGMELLFTKKISALIGYNYLRRKQLALDERRGFSGFSYGLAARFSTLDISFAHAMYHLAGDSYQITLAYKVNQFFNKGNLL